MALYPTLDVAVEDGVTFTFEVTNRGPNPVELRFRTGQRADVRVTEAETGEEVWRWSERRMFTQMISTLELSPGETLEETLTWSDPPAGTYEAEAGLASDQAVSVTATFTV